MGLWSMEGEEGGGEGELGGRGNGEGILRRLLYSSFLPLTEDLLCIFDMFE